MTIEVSDGVRELILAFADDEHLMGQQHTEWIGVAPFLEEDLAFSSIGQDELGHAALLYALLAGDDDLSIDELAFGRGVDGYRSCWLTERVTTDWAEALVRHWLYDSVEQLRWGLFADSSIPALADVADRAEREETFHRRHGDGLLDVLLVDDDTRPRLLTALDELMPVAIGLFEGVAGEAEAVEAGVIAGPLVEHLPAWRATVAERFGVEVDAEVVGPEQGARTIHSDALGPLLTRMREVFDLDPQAVW